MNNTVKRIILIDDDPTTNFLHRIIIESLKLTNEIQIFQRALEALEFIGSLSEEEARGTVLFLDLNMPEMTGWEFLEEYNAVNGRLNAVYVVSATINPDDEIRAYNSGLVSGFLNKPLEKQKVFELLSSTVKMKVA